jgi:hypothetical protein
MKMTRFSFQRLDDNTWGIKASGNLGAATGHAGRTVDVITRSGALKVVTLGAMVTSWNGGRAATYAIAPSANGHANHGVPRTGSSVAVALNAADAMEAAAEASAYAAEIADDIDNAAAYVVHRADAIRAAWRSSAVRGDTVRSSYYDTTTYTFTVPFDADATVVRDALAHRDGDNMYAYGSFGGYSTIGHVTEIAPRTFAVESVYHIGD